MLAMSNAYTHAHPYYAPFMDAGDYPRPLLSHRDMHDGCWSLNSSWKPFNKASAWHWIKFTYEHCEGEQIFTILYDKEKQQAVLETSAEKYTDEDGHERFYNGKTVYIPHLYKTSPTLHQTLCNIGFTDDEICNLRYPYEVDDFIELTYEEKTAQEVRDEEPEDEDEDF